LGCGRTLPMRLGPSGRLRIAQVAPLSESVPPKLYGGTERVVSVLTEELVRQGHAVTLFASGDSRTTATLVASCVRAQRLVGCADPLSAHMLMIEQVAQRAKDFDIIHYHVAPVHFPLARRMVTPHLTTLHGRLDLPDLVPLYEEFNELPLVSISDAQRAPLPNQNWVGTVHHGFFEKDFRFHAGPGSYLAFLGRIAREKRVDRAIEIAKACGWPLKIAAKVDPSDVLYFKNEIAPLMKHPLIEFVGEIPDSKKSDFLGHARAMLFPIDWPEPFGLVMIEALACGTPTIAFRCGSVPEIIDDGVTGFIVDSVEEAIESLKRIPKLSREKCRQVFEERFSASRMVKDYLSIYARIQSEAPARAA
jgi:glycosyltransferase involved in cell wall biosynthesis